MRVARPLFLLFLGLIVLTWPQQIAAQPFPSYCAWVQPECGAPNMHYAALATNGPANDPHGDCQEDGHWPEHEDCEVTQDPELRPAYSAALDAAARGDVEALLPLVPQLRAYLTYNEARNALQLKSCKATYVVASLTVPAQILDRALDALNPPLTE